MTKFGVQKKFQIFLVGVVTSIYLDLEVDLGLPISK